MSGHCCLFFTQLWMGKVGQAFYNTQLFTSSNKSSNKMFMHTTYSEQKVIVSNITTHCKHSITSGNSFSWKPVFFLDSFDYKCFSPILLPAVATEATQPLSSSICVLRKKKSWYVAFINTYKYITHAKFKNLRFRFLNNLSHSKQKRGQRNPLIQSVNFPPLYFLLGNVWFSMLEFV